jgi:hypothetical protein
MLVFVGPRIEDHPGTRTETFDFRDIVHAKSAPFVKAAGMGKDVPTARLINVQFDPLTANGTLCPKGVKSPPAQNLYQFHKPYRQVSHVWRLTYLVH